MSFKDTAFGQIMNRISNHRLFLQQEEIPGFVIPEKYTLTTDSKSSSFGQDASSDISNEFESKKTHDLEQAQERELEQPFPTKEGYIVVDWYGENDMDNPHNWSNTRRAWVVALISLFTAVTYMGTSVYTPGIEQMMSDLDTTKVKALVPLTIFVVGYGIAPMVLSPLSEHAPFGRTGIYIVTLLFFVVIQVPTALSNTIEKIIGLRFLAGIAVSPVLSTGAASCGEIFRPESMFIGMLIWGWAASSGPSTGPLFGGIFAQLLNWRWCFWFLCIATGVLALLLFLTLPETLPDNILHRRAARLRRITGNELIRSKHEIESMTNKKSSKDIAIELLWRPIYIAFLEPMVFFLNLYISFVYIIINSWFEAFPIVFTEFYKFNLIESGITYLSCCIGATFGAIIYYFVFTRVVLKDPHPKVESFLIPSIVGSFFPPVGLFLFSWGASTHTHWIAPVIGAGIFMAGAIQIFQSIFSYLGHSYIRYMASVFAGNCLMRSCLAAVFPLFVGDMFTNLATPNYPVGPGGSILGAVSVLMMVIPFCFYKYGHKFRGRSKYAN